ncbi:MAG: hypothetical protein LBE18_03295, partial [Planctomycetaceae bacterium]|nr:hypothetical protein [Planctomycetaceae bacterium]
KTFATHNRNTADSKQDNPTEDTTTNKPKGYVNSNTNHDQHYDQIFKPEGSLFVELYRAADPTRRRTPNDFYNSDNSLDLAKTNPDGEPVWRIAISKHTKTHPNDTQPTSNYRINSVVNNLEHPRTSNAYPFQPTQWNGAASTQQEIAKDTVKSERFIYFVNDIPNFINTNLADSESMIKSMSFVNIGGVNNDGTRTGNNVVLQPNNFLLIAPRVLTSFKSKEVDETTTTDKFGVPDGLDDGSDGTKINLKSLSSNSVKTMVAAMKIDNIFSWKDTPNILALGFKTGDPTPALDTRYRGVGVNVSEILPNTGINVGEASYYAKPTFESDTEKDYYPSNTTDFNNPYPTTTVYGEERTEDADFVMGFGTIPGFRSMFLQRLADADRRYHPVNNPYITVDWSMIDLHVFTSEKVKNAPFATGGFANSREGEFAAPAANNPTDRLKFTGDPKLYFNIREWGTTANHDEDDFTTPPTPIASLPTRRPNIRHRSFRTVEVTSAGTTTNVEVIENNPSLLGNEIANKYEPPKLPTSNDNPKWGQLSYKYGAKHTSASADLDTSGNFHPNVDLAGIPQQGFLHFPWNDSPLANTFELMLVPAVSASRFGYDCYDTATIIPLKMGKSLGMDGNARFRNKTSGTGPYLNFFTNGRPNPDGAGDSLDLVRLFEYVHVPSRFISTNQPLSAMREPGKININTMTEKSWQALVGDSIVNTNYANIKDQRNPTAAIEFANPFRSSHAANFVPELMMSRQPVETTLLGLIEPKLVADNIYTSLHPIMRLSEMTTTRSNVFAIWITTGYFKVEGEGDGEQLCEEIGSYGGKMERRRDFYIIDRSIPVGFIRGEKLNTDNIILLKKSLE